MMPRLGMVNSRCTRSFTISILVISPLWVDTNSMILPEHSSGVLTVSISTGSHLMPSISLMITCGCPTCNSYPSRRIVSMSTLRCSTPRPKTRQLLSSAPFSTRSARFFSNSLLRRSCICRLVTNLPSCPKNGLSLMQKVMDIVGSSMAIGSNASGSLKSQIVSPISNPSIPIIAHISPLRTTSVLMCPIPEKVCNSLILVLISIFSPFAVSPLALANITCCPSLNSPRCTRPIAIRPT